MTQNDANTALGQAPRGILWFLRSLGPHLARYRRQSTLLLLLLLVDVGFEAMVPLGFRMLIDDAIGPQRLDLLVTILTTLCGVGLVVALSQVARDALYAYLGAHILHDLRVHMYTHLQRLPVGFFARTGSADIMARFSTDQIGRAHV